MGKIGYKRGMTIIIESWGFSHQKIFHAYIDCNQRKW